MADLSQNSQDPRPERYLRFPMAVRLSHWVAAAAIFTLLWSGLWIFNLHPRLYWGDVGYFGSPAIAELQADMSGETTSMAIRVGSLSMDVTGLIGKVNVLPFVRVMNFPEGFQFGGTRALHFTAAWVLVICWMLYVYHLVSSGRLKTNWLPRASELTPRHLAYEIVNHLKLRRTRGEAIKKYNVLQKLAYLSVMFGLLPLLLLTWLRTRPKKSHEKRSSGTKTRIRTRIGTDPEPPTTRQVYSLPLTNCTALGICNAPSR